MRSVLTLWIGARGGELECEGLEQRDAACGEDSPSCDA
jgi:hypothetical protein